MDHKVSEWVDFENMTTVWIRSYTCKVDYESLERASTTMCHSDNAE